MNASASRTSIVIATFNRAERLAACLSALGRQTAAPTDFEVIVVVDGSNDGTHEWLGSYSAPYMLRTLFQQNQGQCVALNRGAAEAGGELLIFLDDDILVSPGFVEEHASLLARDPSAVGVGQMLLLPAEEAGWFTCAFGESWRKHYERLNANPTSVTWRDCFGGNMSVARAAFVHIGGFATDLARGYDVELAARLEQAGGHFFYLPGAIGTQDERKDLRALLRDSELGGRGAVDVYRRNPRALSLISHFPEQTPQAAVMLRALLQLGPSPVLLARLLWFAPRLGRDQIVFDLVHRYAFWRGVKAGLNDSAAWEQLAHGVVILMYHGLCLPGERPGRYLIPIRRFAAQMRWLKWRGYQILDLESYMALRDSGTLPPARAVVITIDDGYAEVAHVAPLLQRLGGAATVFLPTAREGEVNDWAPESELYARRLLSWDEVRHLRARGMRFGAHSRRHRLLTELEADSLQDEIEGAQTDFERETGACVTAFSYPYGEYGPEMAGLLEAAGYSAAVSVDPGPNTPATARYALRRVEIRGTDSLLGFAYAVAMGREFRAARRRAVQVARQLMTGGLCRARHAWKSRRATRVPVTEKS